MPESSPTDFAELFAEHQPRVFGYILAIVRNSADANDILQQTAVTLWNKFDGFEPGTDFAAWAITTARFESLNFLKYRRRSRLSFDQSVIELLATEFEEPSSDLIDARRSALRKCLAKLSPLDAKLIDNRYSHGLGSRQLAELMDRSQASVCNSLRRIREALLACIQHRLDQEGAT